MAKVRVGNPTPTTLPKAKGVFYTRLDPKFGPIAQTPGLPGGRKTHTPYQFYQRQEFGIAAHWASNTFELGIEQAKNFADGTRYVWRDILIMASYGNLFEIQGPDGQQWGRVRDVSPNPQLVLDLVTDYPGSLLYRSPSGWVGIMPAATGTYLQMVDAVPTWGPITVPPPFNPNTLWTAAYASKGAAKLIRQQNSLMDGYTTSDGVDATSINAAVDTVNGFLAPSTSTSTTTVNSPNSISGNAGYTMFARHVVLTPGGIITKIGHYCSTAQTMKYKIARRETTGEYSVVVNLTHVHGGTGWEDESLGGSPYTVPSDGHDYFVGIYAPTTDGPLNLGSDALRAYKSGDISGVNQTGFTEDLSYCPCMRFESSSGTANNLTLVTTYQAADNTVSFARLYLELFEIDAMTLNTDITGEVTTDGGSHWQAGTLVPFGSGTGDSVIIGFDAIATPTPGTTFAARVKSFNGKHFHIQALAVDAL
jgi:hypothetical protein